MSNIDPLIANLRTAKQKLNEAKDEVFEAEKALYLAVKDQLPAKGTTTFGDLKITTGFHEKWDQEALATVRARFVEPWPFIAEWKPENKAIAYLRESKPEAYALIAPALSREPKKPAFKLTGEKE